MYWRKSVAAIGLIVFSFGCSWDHWGRWLVFVVAGVMFSPMSIRLDDLERRERLREENNQEFAKKFFGRGYR
jgi:hypothetical protein